MNKPILFLVFVLITSNLMGQTKLVKQLGASEKIWVLLHPFSAKKAYRISLHTLQTIDSLKQENYFKQNTKSGSRADALRHCYWMSMLASQIGPKRALWLGNAHEKKNKKDFKKKRLEEAYLPDSVAITMDLENNVVGAKLGEQCKECKEKELLIQCQSLLLSGGLLYIKQNKDGQFLSEKGHLIPSSTWQGSWKNQRVLVPTNWTTSQSPN